MSSNLRAALGIPRRGAFPHPTLVMGIVNVTPDSFQSEGRHTGTDAAVQHARRLIADVGPTELGTDRIQRGDTAHLENGGCAAPE